MGVKSDQFFFDNILFYFVHGSKRAANIRMWPVYSWLGLTERLAQFWWSETHALICARCASPLRAPAPRWTSASPEGLTRTAAVHGRPPGGYTASGRFLQPVESVGCENSPHDPEERKVILCFSFILFYTDAALKCQMTARDLSHEGASWANKYLPFESHSCCLRPAGLLHHVSCSSKKSPDLSSAAPETDQVLQELQLQHLGSGLHLCCMLLEILCAWGFSTKH